jgi:hypothetical protein
MVDGGSVFGACILFLDLSFCISFICVHSFESTCLRVS